jgi:hypothetical protein
MAMIGEEARKILEDSIGLPMDKICELNTYEEIALVESRTGKKLRFAKVQDKRKIGRGNPLLARRKIKTIEEINAKIDALKN